MQLAVKHRQTVQDAVTAEIEAIFAKIAAQI